ncbi:MAG: alpha/beta hydrolase [Pseudohongiella sp.]|nr:alpha/beta hydrolase [Pseudohongiella sp.]MDO9518704.1 alpha/beta hydrolase [Pseudohongiella sp.]MDP2128016.1 alpha/beta hydrolase [Pseudohongiella sp.]
MLTRIDIKSRSLRSYFVSWFLKRQFKPKLLDPDFDPIRFRKALDRDMGRRSNARDVAVEQIVHNDVRGEWNTPVNTESRRVILYCHGGGYLFGSPLSYRSFTTRLAEAADARVFVLDYRLAPEHPFPAAADDVIAAYRWLLETTQAQDIILAGDSAGAGLSLSLLVQIREADLPMPSAAILMSPYADLNTTGASLDANAVTCAMFSGDSIRRAAATYLSGADALDPRASPLYADYAGFPPLLIYVSDSEVLRDDGLRVADKAAAAGVPTQLQVWRGQPHVWPLFVPQLPEASRALKEMADFCRKH